MGRFMHRRTGGVVGAAALIVVLGATTAMAVPASIQTGLDRFSTSDASGFAEIQPAVLQPDTGDTLVANELPPPDPEEAMPTADQAAETQNGERRPQPQRERAESPPEPLAEPIVEPEPPATQAEPIQPSQEPAPPPAPETGASAAPAPVPDPSVAPPPAPETLAPPPPATDAAGAAPPPPPDPASAAPPPPPGASGAPAPKGFGGPKG